ncbi:MAG: hypothetical protein OHK0023_04770 [Anaerolineae bacterium]
MVKGWYHHVARRHIGLDAKHPVAVRDRLFLPEFLPPRIKRWSNIWTLLGVAALIHGGMFIVGVLLYHSNTANQDLLPVFSPFLTPFGTPIIVAILHTFIYWSLLLGIARQMTFSFTRELEARSWGILRLTPYDSSELALAKAANVGRSWWPVLSVLCLIRLSALVIMPVAIASQRTREVSVISYFDVAGAILFVVQPYAEAFMVGGLALALAVMIRNPLWAKFYTYTAIALTIGGLSFASAMWLAFNSPIGGFAALLVPLGQWTPLVVSALPPATQMLYGQQTLLLTVTTLGLPLLIGWLCFRFGFQRLRSLC